MTLIRPLLVALPLMALVLIMDTAPADAQTATCRPWCRERSGGGTNCGFVSFEQCMWASQGADSLYAQRSVPAAGEHTLTP